MSRCDEFVEWIGGMDGCCGRVRCVRWWAINRSRFTGPAIVVQIFLSTRDFNQGTCNNKSRNTYSSRHREKLNRSFHCYYNAVDLSIPETESAR